MAAKRAIFEDVSDNKQAQAAPQGGVIDRRPKGARGAIRIWLMVLFALVCVMIAVGGMTRLTDSGLSITEWRPVTGALPPLNAADWAAEFEKYRQIDQYRLMNQGMSLDEFKVIYWWEWGHRQLGRVIGLVWAVGFLFFWLTKRIPTGWTPRLLFLGALGGLQGAIGWWMVASGLTEGMVSVASYRLATHLGLAFVILGFIAWYAFLLNRPEAELMTARRAREAKLFSLSTGLMHFAFLQILLGALVAGIDAGRGYTDWPMMNGVFFPPEALDIVPLWQNFFENPAMAQFVHRMAGYLLAVFALVVWLRGRKSAHGATRFAFNAVGLVVLAQIILGIVTVIYAAPWQLGIAHQATAVLLWVLIIRARHLSQYPRFDSLRGAKA
ncbi:MAG: cytochrome c oxidase assembly protein subunit CtaA [Roseibaca calidilacus]|uniref:Heme A synthase n=1 Tax=Roseibaca calidilacus TaxID=1666912 RepID=A0A0P7W735_9RHOB|nr:heme A synthase [Roseibaca calidilacus]KPP92800.1 MAG: cytochrome c oxidase assembly protein subunit CtaA [Roseibaca calidilacus]CUX80128.1 cytochrome c oxidase assembly protein subunit 15 [Roseibaca calidilacus]